MSEDKPISSPHSHDPKPPEWVLRVREFAAQIAPPNFYGSVQLNFQAGGVTQTEYRQSIR